MSIQVNYNKDKSLLDHNIISKKEYEKIDKELLVKIEPTFGIGETKYIRPFRITNDNKVILPFSYASRHMKLRRPLRETFSKMNVKFKGKLRDEQSIVKKEAVKRLGKRGSVILALHCGFGKTILAINLACSIKLKTLIIVNKIILIKQWKDSITKFCRSSKIQILSSKSVNKDSDFYIINAQNVEKLGAEFFKDIGLCIVDESHLIMAETLSKSLNYVFPRYLIGLSATPYRHDGLDILLEYYMGKYKIIRKLYREHKVFIVKTGLKPKIERNIKGRMIWGSVLDSQANSIDRNNLILSIILKYSSRNILVLVKRVSHGNYLLNILRENGVSVTSLLGNKQEFNHESRVLIGTCQKVGTGFDHKKLDTLILASDIKQYFEQYLGRIFRVKDTIPFVFDLLDDNSTLKKHFNCRKKIYKEIGANFINYDPTRVY